MPCLHYIFQRKGSVKKFTIQAFVTPGNMNSLLDLSAQFNQVVVRQLHISIPICNILILGRTLRYNNKVGQNWSATVTVKIKNWDCKHWVTLLIMYDIYGYQGSVSGICSSIFFTVCKITLIATWTRRLMFHCSGRANTFNIFTKFSCDSR